MAPPEVVNDLRDLEQSLIDPVARKSREAVSALLADDFFEYGTSGTIYDKVAVLDGMAGEAPSNVVMSDFEARALGTDLYLATFKTVRLDKSGQVASRSLRSSLWRRANGRWQLLFHQGTRVPSE